MKFYEFYDTFSDFYDDMTRFDFRLQNEKNFFIKLKEKFKFTKVIDIGCGTGAHSFILADCGAEVTGIDPSRGMIEKALLHLQTNEKVKFENTTLEGFSDRSASVYDAAFFMGNSLPHITEEKNLKMFIKALKKVLVPGGIFILQILNYKKILMEKERIINIRETDEKTYIRFYDFISDTKLNFNILTLSGEKNERTHKIITTELYAYTKEQLFDFFSRYNFEFVETFGNFKMEEFSSKTSPNLIMVFKNNL